MINKKIIRTAITVILLSFITYAGLHIKDNYEYKGHGSYGGEVLIGHRLYKAYVADNDIQRGKGLSGRPKLADNELMAFFFERPDKYGIWMKDMNFPIDILWIDDSYKIVFMKNDAQPDSYPEVFLPTTSTHIILEANSDFIEKNNLKIGDNVVFKNF